MEMRHRKKSEKVTASVLGTVGKVFLFILTFALCISLTLYLTMKVICNTSDVSKNTFITTVLETGQMKFLASLCLSEEEIQAVVDANSMEKMEDGDVDEDLIKPIYNAAGDGDVIEQSNGQPAIEIVEIPGLTYKATLMIVKDPSRLSLATIRKSDGSWPAKGITLKEIADENGALAAINGGLYSSTDNSGGYPFGVVVSDGVIVRNIPKEWPGLFLVGITENNILQIVDVSDMSPAQCEKMIREMGIRDAVCFQEDATADNNHFVQLIINGKIRDMKGSGSGLNPRTAIGQRADGTLLLLVTDGRGSNSHAGASAADLIEIMSRYGAVNAANLDGGSSTCMYYNGEYLQNSVTFYYSQTSWRLPFAFLVK